MARRANSYNVWVSGKLEYRELDPIAFNCVDYGPKYLGPVTAIASSARAPAYPDVPTVSEASFPALTFDGLAGLLGPREMNS